jgi:hypothetical protein
MIITDSIIIESTVLLTTDDEVELLPEHDGVDDDGHRH